MTFHGPRVANYEKALLPFLISDWSYNSPFHDFHVELAGPGRPTMQSIILNGRGIPAKKLRRETVLLHPKSSNKPGKGEEITY